MRTGLLMPLLLATVLAGCGGDDGSAVAPVREWNVDVVAEAVDVPRPVYPEQARKEGLEGRVVIEVEISADGSVAGSAVTESSGSGVLDEAARAAALRAKFSPARKGGRPVASKLLIPYRFRLADRRQPDDPGEASGWYPASYA